MPAKKSAKKKTKTKTTNTDRAGETRKNGGFSLFDTNLHDHIQESLTALRANKKNRPTTIKSMAELSPEILELDNLALQATFETRGLRARSITEIIGGEGLGKTTLVFTIMGSLMRTSQAPCLYVNTEGENKLPNMDRIKRCLDTNPRTAEKMLRVMEMDLGRELRQTTEYVEDYIKTTRKYLNDNGAENVPIVVAIDTISKMLSPGEAEGVLDGGEDETKKKAKELGASSNLEFSKLMHAWCRRLPYLLDTYNVHLIAVSHQNQKIDMSGFGSPMSADVSAGYNKTKYGGKAIDQNAALQVTLKRTGFAKSGTNEQIGHKIEMRVVKSSVGADNNTLGYVLRTRGMEDGEEYLEPALDFAEGLANTLAEKKILQTKVNRKRYSSDELDVSGATAKEFCQALYERPDLVNKVGRQLGIDGYPPAEWIDDSLSDEGEANGDEGESPGVGEDRSDG